MDLFASIPIPRDIPLPLPADRVFLEAVLVVLFLAHILFVCLMVGGSLVGLTCEVVAARSQRRDLDTLAREITATVTVNKSLAVVLGVGPLLAINALYTVYFYSANALTGTAWIMIVPLVSVAFLLAYAHKYSWDRFARAKRVHIALGASAAVLFLFIPLIFLANINLMLFPTHWTQVRGFLSSLALANVLPRYLHFILACVALTALFLVLYFTRAGYPVETVFEKLDRPALRRVFYAVAFGATLLQLVAGPLVYFTLPDEGVSGFLTALVLVGLALAAAALTLLWWEITAEKGRIGRLYLPIVGLVMCTGFVMGYSRHVYREEAVRDHRQLMAARTSDFSWAAAAAERRAASSRDRDDRPLGQRVFENLCGSCHAIDRQMQGRPSVAEIASLYRGDPAGIVEWTRAPGRKRPGVAPMPALGHLPEEQLQAVADYMLQIGTGTSRPAASSP